MSTTELKHGDVIEQLKLMPDNSVDSILCDPPYNIKMDDWDAFDTNDDFGLWIREWGKEAYRVLKPGGMIAAFSAARTYQYLAYNLDQAGFQCRDMIEWVYWSGMPKGKNLKQCHEPIYLGLKGKVKDMTFNIDDVRIPVKDKPKREIESETTDPETGKVKKTYVKIEGIEINGKVHIPVTVTDD